MMVHAPTAAGLDAAATALCGPDQHHRFAALNAAHAALGDLAPDSLLAVAQWLLDGSRDVPGEVLEVHEVRTDEADQPIHTEAYATVPITEPYASSNLVSGGLLAVGRDDLRAVLALAVEFVSPARHAAIQRLTQAVQS